nr:type I-F CRISPR-associated protein Csy1 [uncultured Moellerella sp.]
MATEITQQILAYIDERKNNKLEEKEKKYLKDLKSANDESRSDIMAKYAIDIQEIKNKFTPYVWLADAAKRAKQISFATHVIKFTHSSARGTNLLSNEYNPQPNYLETAVLVDPAIDSVGNAAALDVAKLLQLRDSQNSIADYLKQDKKDIFNELVQHESDNAVWFASFKQILIDSSLKSSVLAKQIYFPVSENAYHLISPLYSSSLAQVLYDKIHFSRYNEQSVASRKAKRENKASEIPIIAYLNLAMATSGGSNPQGVSLLNNNRNGRTYLFPCSPPQWQSQTKLPLMISNWFDGYEIRQQTKQLTQKLTHFLIEINEKESNKPIRDYRDRLINQIIDNLFNIAARHQQADIGWAQSSELPRYQQYWLDPQSEAAQENSDNWQVPVARDFALWLNHRIETISKSQLILGNVETNLWQGLFEQALWEAK